MYLIDLKQFLSSKILFNTFLQLQHGASHVEGNYYFFEKLDVELTPDLHNKTVFSKG